MDGIIPLFKPRGMTSYDCVFKLRKILHERKIGHSGTLDPSVDGVLPICVGQATKVVDRLVQSGKRYVGEITIGFATTTEDLDGETVDTKAVTKPFTNEQLDAALVAFTGEISQTPPMFSAVKVNGRRLYEYARAGETVERPSRQITIHAFKRTNEPTFDAQTGTQRFRFEVACSKGTYIRTLAVDVGQSLGFPAVMSDLTRIQSGGFQLAQTVTFEQLQQAMTDDNVQQYLRPLDYALKDLPTLALTDGQWALVKNGVFLALPNFTNQSEVVLTYHDKVKAVYALKPDTTDEFKPEKMFLLNQ